jgi:RimJ/RimL family protein N-acetyltransferase
MGTLQAVSATDNRGFEAAATLKNGLAVTIRELRPDDRDAIVRAVAGLDEQTIYTRLFSFHPVAAADIDRIMHVDPAHEVALVVVIGTPPTHQIIGSCRLVEFATGSGRRAAEVAFTVEEDYQGLGIAGELLERLIEIARSRGIDELEADVLAGNRSMLRVFDRSGLPIDLRHDGVSVHLTMPLP